jgi:MFS family permease
MFLLTAEFRRNQLSIAALFFFLGFHAASWASRLPAIKESLGLSPAEIGVLLLACGLGAALSFPLVAVLMNRLGSRRLVFLSALILCAILPALAWVSSYTFAIVIMFCDGVACAMLNAGMNSQAAALEEKSGQVTMSKLHATFSFGALAAALFSSAVLLLTPRMSVHFAAATLILLLLLLYAREGLLPAQPPRQKKDSGRFARPSATVLWLGLAVFFGTLTEGAMNDWSALYLREIGAASQVAPLGIAVVSIMMALARLFADGWRARWGDQRIVLCGGLLAASGLSTALWLGGVPSALLGFACVGLGMAAVTPCIYVAAARHGSLALTLVAAMGVTGLLAGPPLIGFVADASNLAWGMGCVALSAAAVSVCAARIRWSRSSGSAESSVAPSSTTLANSAEQSGQPV